MHVQSRLILFSALFVSLNQSGYSQYDIQRHVSVYNNRVNDIVGKPIKDEDCKEGVKRAEADFNEGKRKFCLAEGPFYSFPRMKSELIDLIESDGFEIVHDTTDSEQGKRLSCYCAAYVLHNKAQFGKGFRRNMFLRADSLYAERVLRENEVVNNWILDEKATNAQGEEIDNHIHNFASLDSLCDMDFVNVFFTVDQVGNLSNFELKDDIRYVQLSGECRTRIMEMVKPIAESHGWKPGKLHGKAVRTRVSETIYLIER